MHDTIDTTGTTGTIIPMIETTLEMEQAGEALRILTTDEHAVRRAAVPTGCAQRDDILFGSSDVVIGGPMRLVQLAGQNDCDVIDVTLNTAGQLQVSLGKTMIWNTVWYDDYRLWRSPETTEMYFISADPDEQMWFRVEDGRLVGCMGGLPYADAYERQIGLRLGDAALRRLAKVR